VASCGRSLLGHSGGTAPVLHRTSLDHRPMCSGTLHRPGNERGGPQAAPRETNQNPRYFFFFDFFFVHFWLKLADFVLPSVNVVVSLCSQLPSLHFAIT